MKIVLINPPHTAIGSRVPDDHLPPLGLLALGGPLIDAGHQVRLVDAEFGPMPLDTLVSDALSDCPDCILIGHSGSTSAHPTALRIARMVKDARPATMVIYGGVFPTYHWRDILAETDVFDFIVRGEGEATIVALVEALERRQPLSGVAGIAFRDDLRPALRHRPARTIADLDDYRVGWELIDHRRYSYWGGKRAVVMQFSRGCPHLCNYCGQRGFWTRWRHRDPVQVRAGDRLAAPRARRRTDQPCRREPDLVEEGLARLSRRHDRRERAGADRRLDPRRRHRARRRHPAPLPQGRRHPLAARHGEHRRADACS